MNITLSNGLQMPLLIQGVPLLLNYGNKSFTSFYNIINLSVQSGIRAFDTSHDYGKSEVYLGKALEKMITAGKIKRDEIFITTKIGNTQQREGNIEQYVENALKALRLDSIDLMLLHWPTPDVYIENWKKLEKLYEAGKLKAIGIANVQERHLRQLLNSDIHVKPHVVQFEYHPFRTVPDLVSYCKGNNIVIQAYSSLLQMIPMITENLLLNELADKYGKSIPQIVLRWHIQQGVDPLFRTYNPKHLVETIDIFGFELSDTDMESISSLNACYKLHPESMNCPGF